MKRKPFGTTGLEISEIGFGSWALGAMWGPQEDDVSLRALERAMELGVNFIDTAQVYGDGKSESLIAQALKRTGKAGEVLVATKIPPKDYGWPATADDVREAFPKDYVLEMTEESLRVLDTDCIGLMQLHVWNDAWTEQHDWLEAFHKLRDQGKIRFFGVSINDHEPHNALKLAKSGYVHSIQVVYNMFDQSPEDELLPAALEKNVAVIARVPFDEGSLTGKFTTATTFHEDDFRAQYFGGDRLKETVERVEKLKCTLVPEYADNLAQAALRFVLSHPAVNAAIPGIRSPKQAEMNCAASGSPLSKAALAEIKNHRWVRNFYD